MMPHVLKIILIVLLLLIGAVIMVVVFLWRWLNTTVRFKRAKCQRILDAILDGTLAKGVQGEFLLPPRLRSVSITGNVYITHGEEGLVTVLFETSSFNAVRGLRHGYLFCSRPLTSTDTYDCSNEDGNSVKCFDVYYGDIERPSYSSEEDGNPEKSDDVNDEEMKKRPYMRPYIVYNKVIAPCIYSVCWEA